MKFKNQYKISLLLIGVAISCSNLMAGNEDRVGSAGATQLLVNPWARSTALGDAGVASTNGLEATFTNIAGLAFTDKTQLKFNYSNWLGSAGVAFNGVGLAQRVSESGVLAASVQSMNFGDVPITTVDLPEGNIGVFSPRLNVFNIGYAKSFSASISGGLNMKVISESISNLKGTGVAFDAGVRYVTGENNHIKLGIALKNVGPVIRYKGDGLTEDFNIVTNQQFTSLDQRSASLELPSLLNIGASYDFIFSEASKLTACAAFTANSFQYDQYRFGADYGFTTEKAAFNVRAGYVFEKNIFSVENRSNALTGLTGGFSADLLFGKNKSAMGLEYAVRTAGIFGFVHTFGVTISLK